MCGKQLGFGDYEQSTPQKQIKWEKFSLEWIGLCVGSC